MPEPDYAERFDGKAAASYYRHARPHDAARIPRGVNGLPMPARPLVEAPANYWGRGMLRTPGDGVVAPEDVDARAYLPTPFAGVWRPEDHVPIMRGHRILPRYHM